MLVPLFSSKGQNLNFVFEGNYGTNSGFFNWKYKVLVYLFKVKLSKYIKIMLITDVQNMQNVTNSLASNPPAPVSPVSAYSFQYPMP
jgi:hypothetical protein